MKAYKGFNQDMTCTPAPGVKFQFEEGKTYEEPTADLCHSGFHACEDPLDCFDYYPPSSSVYHVVELEDVSEKRENDSKVCGKRIAIGAKIDLASIIKASVDLRFSKVEKTKRKTNSGYQGAATNSGYRGAATNSGYQGAATNSGDRGAATNSGGQGAATNSGCRGAATNSGYRGAATNSGDLGAATNSGYQGAATNGGDQGAATNSGYQGAATNSGYRGAATNSGKEGVAINLGIDGRVMGALHTWIVCDEWELRNGGWHRVNLKSAYVDGKTIKPDTWYRLKDGKFVEVEL